MAILNFTQTLQKSRLSAFLHRSTYRGQHEKKSCLLLHFSSKKLLSLNGRHIQIRYLDPALGLDYCQSGIVLSVLIPSLGSSDMGILFLPECGSAYYPDPSKTQVLISGL